MKRRTLSGIMTILCFVVLSPVGGFVRFADYGEPSNQSSTDWWPMFHHDLTHTGHSTSTAPNTNNTIWTYKTGETISSIPAVSGGRVYIGSDDYNLYCLDAVTGTYLWNYPTGGAGGSPAISGSKVYVGSYDFSIYCLDAATGAYVWSYPTGGANMYSSPAVADGKVYIGSGDFNVYCLNAQSGAYVWSYPTGGGVYSSPAVSGGKVYIGSDDYNLYCLDATTGTYVWNYTTGGAVWSSPAVAGGRVYVGSHDGNVYCVDAATGEEVWSYPTGNGVLSSPAVADGKVYIGSYDSNVYCLNAQSGAYVWSYPTGGGNMYSSPAVADGKVYIGSDTDWRVYCLNAATGAYVWSYITLGAVYSSPAVADGKVYVGSTSGTVYAFGSAITPIHDVAVLGITCSSSIVSPKGNVIIQVMVENQGTYDEIVAVSVYAGSSLIDAFGCWVPSETTYSYDVTWFVSAGCPEGVYPIWAWAHPIPYETDTSDNTFFGDSVSVLGRGLFIIVAGSYNNGTHDPCQEDINYGCNQVYNRLLRMGYSRDEIYYLNQPDYQVQDVDGNGDPNDDVDAVASINNLGWGIYDWAPGFVGPTQPLYLYLFDHGDVDAFHVDYHKESGPKEFLHPELLDDWLDDIESLGAPTCVVIAACHSGSFTDNLDSSGQRIVITSCNATQHSYGAPSTWEAFSLPFWTAISSGYSIAYSFDVACQNVAAHGWPQTPLLDDSGDGIACTRPLPIHEGGDGSLANQIYLTLSEWSSPYIVQTVSTQTFAWPPPAAITLWAKVASKTAITSVRAYMITPDWTGPPPDDVLSPLNLPFFEMTDISHDGNYSLDIPAINFTSHASGPSSFRFIFTAIEGNGDIAVPTVADVVFTETGDPPPDDEAPEVYVMRPHNLSVAMGTVRINGTAFDNMCLQEIELNIEGDLVDVINLALVSSSYFEFSVDTTTLENGPVSLMVKAYDASGKSANKTLTIIVHNFIHDVIVTKVSAEKTVVSLGSAFGLNVTVANHGSYAEDFNVTIYANTSAIHTELLTLNSLTTSAFYVYWDTTGFALGNYTISANATSVPGESNTYDNIYVYGTVLVTIPGDVNGDRTVGALDLQVLSQAYGSTPTSPRWNPNADTNNDEIVDVQDVRIVGIHWAESW